MSRWPLWGMALLLLCTQSETSRHGDDQVPFEYEQIGTLNDAALREISGMALSQIDDDVLWVVNDSGDDALLYAISKKGNLVQTCRIKNAENQDWEDLASFTLADTAYLVIADIGNNVRHRDIFTLYILKEPRVVGGTVTASVPVDRIIRFQYQDGPRDCEAMAVDVDRNAIVILSKRNAPPLLYSIPLDANPDEIVVARLLGHVHSIPEPQEDEIVSYLDRFHAQPTALDLASRGHQVAILTYRRLFLYPRADDETLIETVNKEALMIEFPKLEQAESMCFDFDQESVLITSEQLPAPLIRITPTSF